MVSALDGTARGSAILRRFAPRGTALLGIFASTGGKTDRKETS